MKTNLGFDEIIKISSAIDNFRKKYNTFDVCDRGDAINLNNMKKIAECYDKQAVAKLCSDFLIKSYSFNLSKQDPSSIDFYRMRGGTIFPRYSNTVSMEAVDHISSENKFIPLVPEITECLDYIAIAQEKLFDQVNKAISSPQTSSKTNTDFTEKMLRQLASVMNPEAFVSWSKNMLEFRYLDNTSTITLVTKNNFQKDAIRSRFSNDILTAANNLGFKASSVRVVLQDEADTSDPASPQFETSKFKKNLYLTANPLWTRGLVKDISLLQLNREKAQAVVSCVYACNSLIRFLEEKALLIVQRIHPSIQAFEFVAQGNHQKTFEDCTKKFVYGLPMTQKEYEDILALMKRLEGNQN